MKSENPRNKFTCKILSFLNCGVHHQTFEHFRRMSTVPDNTNALVCHAPTQHYKQIHDWFDLLDKMERRTSKAHIFLHWYISFQTKHKLKGTATVVSFNQVTSKANQEKIPQFQQTQRLIHPCYKLQTSTSYRPWQNTIVYNKNCTSIPTLGAEILLSISANTTHLRWSKSTYSHHICPAGI